MRSKHWWVALVFILSLFVGVSCKNLIYDDLKDCPHYLAVKLNFNDNVCGHNYSNDEIGSTMISVYDDKGKLVANEITDWNGSDYKLVKVPAALKYHLVVWNSKELQAFENSQIESDRNNIFSFRKEVVESDMQLANLFYGSKIADGSLEEATVVDSLELDMQSYKYHLDVNVGGLYKNANYEIQLVSDNKAYDNYGGVVGKSITYMADMKEVTDMKYKASIDLYRLYQGSSTVLKIVNKDTGKEEFSFRLIPLLNKISQNKEGKNVDFRCQHNFELNLDVSVDTYMRPIVYILPWKLVVREEILKGTIL